MAAEVEQEAGRRWAEERRAAQVEHERGLRAEQRDKVGLEHPVVVLEVADERRDDGVPGGATVPVGRKTEILWPLYALPQARALLS